MTEFEKMNTPYCWELEIRNVQLSDSGSYMCHVNANQQPAVNYTIEFQVKGEPFAKLALLYFLCCQGLLSFDCFLFLFSLMY